jgi:hypothetical protein
MRNTDGDDGVRVDEVVVAWGFVSDPLENPTSGVVLRLNPDGLVDPVALVNELESLQRSGNIAPDADPTTFILRQHFNHYSWGADAATLTFLMYVAAPVTASIVANALYDGLKSISKMLTRRDAHAITAPPSPSDANEIRIAINAVESLYEFPAGKLTAELVSRDSESAVVKVRDNNGTKYRVQTVWNESGGVLTRIDPFSEI